MPAGRPPCGLRWWTKSSRQGDFPVDSTGVENEGDDLLFGVKGFPGPILDAVWP